MASSLISFFLLCLIFFSETHLSLSTRATPTKPIADIHDLLPHYGFPKGLIPDAVKSYTISPDGSFAVELERPCYVQFEELVYYHEKIKGKMSYGSVSDVSGIQVKQLFLWLGVSGMTVDFSLGLIEFHAGAFSKKLPAHQFEDIPHCQNKGCGESSFDSI